MTAPEFEDRWSLITNPIVRAYVDSLEDGIEGEFGLDEPERWACAPSWERAVESAGAAAVQEERKEAPPT